MTADPRPLGAGWLGDPMACPQATGGHCRSLGYERLAAFSLVSLISWEQEPCRDLTDPFRKNRGSRIRSGLMWGNMIQASLCMPLPPHPTPVPPGCMPWAAGCPPSRGAALLNERRWSTFHVYLDCTDPPQARDLFMSHVPQKPRDPSTTLWKEGCAQQHSMCIFPMVPGFATTF